MVQYSVVVVLWKKISFENCFYYYYYIYPMIRMELPVNLKVEHEHERLILGIDYEVDLLE